MTTLRERVPMKDVIMYGAPKKARLLYDFTLYEGEDFDEEYTHYEEGSLLIIIGEFKKLVVSSYKKQFICIAPDCADVTSLFEEHVELATEEGA